MPLNSVSLTSGSCGQQGLCNRSRWRIVSAHTACRKHVHAVRATSDEIGKSPLAVCTEAVNELMQSISQSGDTRLDSLLEYVPDALLDKAIAAKKADGSSSQAVRFSDLMGFMRVGDFTQMSDLLFDSYAMRMLVYQQPSEARLLSSLMPSKDKSVHRLLVKSEKEEAILTVAMQLQEGLVSQYRSAPRIDQLWRLKSISGEPDSGELPSQPDASVGPELVVQAQLEALRQRDIGAVFGFASPRNKAATGPLERFSQMLESPMYKPLLGFSKAESLRRIQLTNETYAEVIGIMSENTGGGRPASFVYVWSVGRVLEDQDAEQAGFWMTNNVQLVSASGVTPWVPPPRDAP